MSSYGTIKSIPSIGIVYAVVARGATVLVRYATCNGNFSDVVPHVLSVIAASEESQMSYAYNSYMFHYIMENSFIVMCITDDDFERSKAFLFLEDIKTRFMNKYGEDITKIAPYSLNDTFCDQLSRQMEYYSEDKYFDVSESPGHFRLENIRVRSLGTSTDDGRDIEPLELLGSDEMSLRSFPVSEDSVEIRRHANTCITCCRKNYGYIIVISILLLVLLAIVIAVIAIVTVEETDK